MQLGLVNPDIALVRRSKSGDQEAFNELVARHKRKIFNLVYRMTGEYDWAEDITIEIFLEAYLSLKKFKEHGKFSTWLHRLAVNVCLEQIRKRKAKRQLKEISLDGNEPISAENTTNTVEENETAQQIISAMQVLPEIQRTALTYFYIDELSCAEIAEILDIPRATVKTRIFHGTRKLRDKLRADGILPSFEGKSDEL